MKHLKKYFTFALACVFTISLTINTAQAVNSKKISITLNGSPLNFTSVKPYQDDTSGRVMVPVRALMENLGAKVDYNNETKEITITKDDSKIILIADDTKANVNGVDLTLDCPATVINSSTYVPLRFVSENMNLKVDWNSQTNSVTLTSNPSVYLGQEKAEITSAFGTPHRIDISEKGYSWYVYSNDMLNYSQIGIKDNKVAAYYLHKQSFVHTTGIRSGLERTVCDELMESNGYDILSKKTYSVYSNNEHFITAYFDSDAKCYAMMAESADHHNLSKITNAVLNGFENTLIDLVNIERTKAELKPLSVDSDLSTIAKQHASDMASKNYYSHVNADGKSPHQRLEASGYSDFYSTEAISKAFPNSFAAFSSHLSNADYVSAMLARYTHIGSGCAFNADSDGILYYTQIFYSQK